MSKIIILLPNTNTGGAERIAYLLVNYLIKLKFRIDIYTIWSETVEKTIWNDLSKQKNITFHFGSTNLIYGFLITIKNLIKDKNVYDFSYTTHVNSSFILGILNYLKILKIKRIIVRESTSIFLRFKGLKLWSYKIRYFLGYRNIDVLICQSTIMKNQLVENIDLAKRVSKIKVIQNPVDLDEIRRLSNMKITKASKFEDGFKSVVSAGRLIPEKGFDLLIEAFNLFHKEDKTFKLYIYGDGPESEKLLTQIKKYDLENYIYLKGFEPNIYPIFKEADICVVSSRIEGFPNVLLQMMALNESVISTTCAGGIDEIEGVITVPTDDINALFLALKNHLKNEKTRVDYDIFLNKNSIKNFWKQIETN